MVNTNEHIRQGAFMALSVSCEGCAVFMKHRYVYRATLLYKQTSAAALTPSSSICLHWSTFVLPVPQHLHISIPASTSAPTSVCGYLGTLFTIIPLTRRYLEKLLRYVYSGLRDSRTCVRNMAIFTVGQFYEHLTVSS